MQNCGFFHDDSTLTLNKDQPTQWGMKGEKMLKLKSKGSGIMVSDFIDEHNGFLALIRNMTEPGCLIHAFVNMPVNCCSVVRARRDIDKTQIQQAEIKYLMEDGWHHIYM